MSGRPSDPVAARCWDLAVGAAQPVSAARRDTTPPPEGESLFPIRVGDRVARRYDGKIGVVHAVYPNDLEDDTEVKFRDGTFTCSNHTKFQKLDRGLQSA